MTPGVSSPERVSKILERLAGTQVGPAMLRAAQARNGKMHVKALDILLSRGGEKALRQVDDFLGDNQLALGRPLGAGMESVVFDARPRVGPDRQVVKIAVRNEMHRPQDAFQLPDIPGVNPYWAHERLGPLAVGVQPRVAVLRDIVPEEADVALDGMARLEDSLHARGYHWDDSMFGNAGLLDDNWVVIDGAVTPFLPGTRMTTSGAAQMRQNPEEAIRALRVRPEERPLFIDGP